MNNIKGITYEETRENLKAFLKGNDKFKDYNFEASGISTLINILAYNAHYLGVYMFALNNESSVDSAQTRQALYSKARGLGYTPKLMKSATCEVVFKTVLDAFPTNGHVILHSGKSITGTSSRIADARNFVNMTNVYLRDWVELPSGKFEFSSKPVVIHEGSFQKWEFVVDQSIKYQSFVIKDKTIDIDTLKVYVKKSDADEGIEYYHFRSLFDIDYDERAFYTTINSDGYVEVYFGANVFGVQPGDGEIISCEYTSCNGEDGNGCDTFTLAGFDVIANEVSNSGSNGESLESTRFNAINHFRMQNRLHTPDDYRSAILSYFRNLQSINIWPGEDNYQKRYGKIFISVKPFHADRLSNSAKKEITRKILNDYKRLGADPVFVDPEFIECDLEVILTTDIAKRSVSYDSVVDEVLKAVNDFNNQKLNVFDNALYEVEIASAIKSASRYIVSAFTRKRFRKSSMIDVSQVASNSIFFGNPIVEGSVKFKLAADETEYNVQDALGKLYATNVKGKVYSIGTVDYKTGLLTFNYPHKVRTDSGRGYKVEVSVIPQNADIKSTFNNIIRISNVEVVDE